MSEYFDVIITCHLPEDTPEEVINIIRCLTDRAFELKEKPNIRNEYFGDLWEVFWDEHFLAPDPEKMSLSNFRKLPWLSIPTENDRVVYRYSLQYSGRYIHDDVWRENHYPFVFWLASYVMDDFIGYMKYSEGGKPDLIFIEDGKPRGNGFLPLENS